VWQRHAICVIWKLGYIMERVEVASAPEKKDRGKRIQSVFCRPIRKAGIMRMWRILVAYVMVIGGTLPSLAQNGVFGGDSSRPTAGSTGGLRAPDDTPSFDASNSNQILRHRDFTGRSCLTVSGYARPHTIDPHLFDHVIEAANSCPQEISISVCYYNSSDCLSVQVPGHDRKQAILGTMPSQKDFRFEFREKFQ
jgi:hypothetical protein